MAVTTENITDILKSVIELLNVDDEGKIELAVDILTLVINFIGAEEVMESIEDGLGNVMEYISELITGENSDLTAEERTEKLAATRSELDALFEKMAAVAVG